MPCVAGSVLFEVCTQEMMTLHVNNIVYKYLCINGFYTSKSDRWKGGGHLSQKEWKKVYSLFSFAYSVSFLDPESSLREDLQSRHSVQREAYFPGSPGSETGLWSPNIPELLGTSGREACRPEGNLDGC